MRTTKKVIITCAVTGSIHTPTMSEHLPVTPEQITADAVAAANAGASMLHLHARDPDTGQPTQNPDVFRRFVPNIKQQCDAIINITTGAGLGMTMEQRLAAAVDLRPEVASMNMGSLNFDISGATSKFEHFDHEWERPYLENTRDFILSNTFAQIETAMRLVGHEGGARFEFECYDIGHLYNLAHFADMGTVEPPFFIQGIFGILGGQGPDLENLMHFKATADRLFGEDYYLSVLAAGRHQMRFVTQSALLGGHVRVGLEDSLYLSKGEMAQSNADQVRKIARILNELSLTPATPAEARDILQTKGRDETAF
jgi:uncharacterized protein (DUF849 family)